MKDLLIFQFVPQLTVIVMWWVYVCEREWQRKRDFSTILRMLRKPCFFFFSESLMTWLSHYGFSASEEFRETLLPASWIWTQILRRILCQKSKTPLKNAEMDRMFCKGCGELWFFFVIRDSWTQQSELRKKQNCLPCGSKLLWKMFTLVGGSSCEPVCPGTQNPCWS